MITTPTNAERLEYAQAAVPPAHWGYLAGGVDDDLTLGMNREALSHYQLRARRLVAATTADLRVDVIGATWDMPIYVRAVGSQQAFHPDGELATARAARAQKAMQMLSTVASTPVEEVATKPMFAGPSGELTSGDANWSYVDRLKKLTGMKLVLKGIDTAEDATLAVEHGADGVVVSNHGGRATETGRGTIDILPEVVDAVRGRIPVFVDGGFRRGSDVYKALAIGARAVGIGRPYIYGLASFCQEGVERVLEILRAELTLTMRQCGTPSIGKITRAAVPRRTSDGAVPPQKDRGHAGASLAIGECS